MNVLVNRDDRNACVFGIWDGIESRFDAVDHGSEDPTCQSIYGCINKKDVCWLPWALVNVAASDIKLISAVGELNLG